MRGNDHGAVMLSGQPWSSLVVEAMRDAGLCEYGVSKALLPLRLGALTRCRICV